MNVQQRARSIGLTGNIACGKSSVASRLASHGAVVIDADVVARELMLPRLPAWLDVVAAFGADITGPGEAIDRAKLRSVVFSDAAALKRLNQAVHPHVHTELVRRLDRLEPDQVAVIEAVAIVEAGTYRDLDALWLVVSPPELQIQRLVQSRGLSREDAAWRVAGQPSVDDKLALADVVIRNDGSLDALNDATDRAWWTALATWQLPIRGDGT